MKLGNYEILYDLAAGGMATVHVARHAGAAGFERLVVIKRVHRHLLQNREFYDMFRNEARVAALLRHPNVVPVIDVVESDGELLLVLDYIESISLSALTRAAVSRGEKIPANVASRIMVDALAGLHAAHEAVDLRGRKLQLVHRDVSPQNIIVGVDGSSRLIDFGIAKALARISTTQSGEVKGKLAYMSPEQVRRQELDRRADVFAAGTVLFEALSGKRLFSGDDEGDVIVNILVGEVPPLTALDGDFPPAINDVLQKALARERDERFESAADFQHALEEAIPPAPDRAVAQTVMAYGEQDVLSRRQRIVSQIESSERGEAPAGANAIETSEQENAPVAEKNAAAPADDSVEAETLVDARPVRLRTTAKAALAFTIALGGAGVWLLVSSRSSPGPTAEVAAPGIAPSTLVTATNPSSTDTPPEPSAPAVAASIATASAAASGGAASRVPRSAAPRAPSRTRPVASGELRHNPYR